MTSIALNNPSAWHPLRVATQTRARNVVDRAPAAALPKRHTRDELQAQGSKIVNVPSRGTARGADGTVTAVTREVPTPAFKTLGYETIEGFITEISEKELREWQAAAAAASSAPRGERVVDTWGAIQPRLSVPPGGVADIELDEHSRLAVFCEGETVTLQISNTDYAKTLRLRTLDTASGETAHVAFIVPKREYSQAAIVSCNGKSAAIIELMPQ